MKVKLEEINGIQHLTFLPIGIEHEITLPVIKSGSRDKYNAWTWNGDLEKPTLKPSIRIRGEYVSHFWLTNGVCNFLDDSTNGYARQNVELLDLKDDKIKEIK